MLMFRLILHLLLWLTAGMQLNLYNTDETLDLGNSQVNCLYYYIDELDPVIGKIAYCSGPMKNSYLFDDDSLYLNGQNFTFDQLRQMNVTTNDLLLWSSTIDLAEQYQYYLDHRDNSSLSTEIFYNCTEPWFGPQCQFSFIVTTEPFEYLVEDHVNRFNRYESPYNIINLPCYMHLTCNRGDSNMCLDWREICDGRIDCQNGAVDEIDCWQLEINECNNDEYRCHNGQCIPKEFLEYSSTECLDQSDTIYPKYFIGRYDIFQTEELSCRTGSEQFVCGNGQCVTDFEQCYNNRHNSLIDYITKQGNLSYTCWLTMICLTHILNQINETFCDELLRPSDINTMLQSCDNDIILFPTVPVLFSHIRFLYRINEMNNWQNDLVLIPDYICYDDRLCDFLIPTYYYGNYSCRHYHQFTKDWNMKYETWSSFIHIIESYFRKCLTTYNHTNYITTDSQYQALLYCCKNSSKCISKHRILDHVSDCYLNDDEEQYELSCSVGDILRFRCGHEDKCYSSTVSFEICPLSPMRTYNQIDFGEFCDGHVQMFTLQNNGQNHTDESDCEYWPCNNYYTRCDGYWSCPDGKDEENCTTQQICPSHSLPCVHPYNYSITCLPANQVNDGNIDCLGAIDERQLCRYTKSDMPTYIYDYFGFHCSNTNECIDEGVLCDGSEYCPNKDDERFCEHLYSFNGCAEIDNPNRSTAEEILCLTVPMKKNWISIENSPIYPPPEQQSAEDSTERSTQSRHDLTFHTTKVTTNKVDDSTWLPQCNYGLYVRHWLGSNNVSYKCFCPPNYYGELCQYQNQRISLTILAQPMEKQIAYAIVISLIDDDDEYQKIISYQQYTILGQKACKRVFNGYLTYETRPKNRSAKYSIRIDVYNKTNLTYLASWHYEIPFSFLPVNRMPIVLYIPVQQVSSENNCQLLCLHGKCLQYINKRMSYCRCDMGWSGIRCNIPLLRNDCSSDSIHVGMIYNRSICVCPVNKGGPRCLLTLSCLIDFCENNGTCVVVDDGRFYLNKKCVCPMRFSGEYCEDSYSKLEISIHDISISTVVLIYFVDFTFDQPGDPATFTVLAQKLTIFQRTILVYTEAQYEMVLLKTDDTYYLAVLQHVPQKSISTSINSSRRCTSITELLRNEQLHWPEIRHVKYYHKLCQMHVDMMCFIDDAYMCLCTLEHEANCFRFNSAPPLCRDQSYCQHGGTCLQDTIKCPTKLMCNCTDCYFGDRCQFYAKGIGLTLDDILRYELRPNVSLSNQSSIIKSSCVLTMIVFVAGLINSILSLLTFSTKKSREVGCGLYLLASSITSLLTVSIFTAKFWFLILTQINPFVSSSILRSGCKSFEFVLKSSLYMDNWFNACVAIERAMTVYKGVSFNKNLSKRIARWVIFIVPLLVMSSIVHDPIYRDLYNDKEEERYWCVFHYSQPIQIYNTIITCIHFLGPFYANIFSALFIIFTNSRRRAITQTRLTYSQHLLEQFKEHKNLIISPIILVILAIPRLIISISSECVKVSHNSWLYLIGYLVSFLSSISIFIVFVLPSEFYKEQFKQTLKCGRR